MPETSFKFCPDISDQRAKLDFLSRYEPHDVFKWETTELPVVYVSGISA